MRQRKTNRVSKHAIRGVTLTQKEGYWQIRKIGLTAERVKNDPAFANTRKQAATFAAALQLAHHINAVLAPPTGIKKLVPGLVAAITKLLCRDKDGNSGWQAWQDSREQWLEGCDLNPQAAWNNTVSFMPSCQYNEEQGRLIVHIPEHKPAAGIQAPPGVKYYRIRTAVITLEGEGPAITGTWAQSSCWPLKPLTIPSFKIQKELPATSRCLHLVFIYLQWYGAGREGTDCVKSDIPVPLVLAGIVKI